MAAVERRNASIVEQPANRACGHESRKIRSGTEGDHKQEAELGATATSKLSAAKSAFSDKDIRRSTGSFYTPRALADWCAHLLNEMRASGSVTDFGCGDGALLRAVQSELPRAHCTGIELDPREASRAQASIGPKGTVWVCNVLNPPNCGSRGLAEYWRGRLGSAPLSVIMNPPWGAVHGLDTAAATRKGLKLAVGQYDTYDLFCELVVQLLRPEERFVFILPDSIFLPEHERLRQLLLSHSELSLIARLGEGIFPGVYRGCVVLAGVRRTPRSDHRVECLRVTKSERAQLSSKTDFERCRKQLSHFVLQDRFAKDRASRFDIDVREQDEAVAKILSTGGGWTEPLWSSRGVEISKSGKVLICETCGAARPLPKQQRPTCLSCGSLLHEDSLLHVIARSRPNGGSWAPFIAGEDVCRYDVQPSRWIRTEVDGLNYKTALPTPEPRLLVRKTGIGLNAAVTTAKAYSNQVVFEYGLRGSKQFDFNYLHYVLGVLCSRVLFAFHLRRTGELEWRSHPYVTQKTLADLPIPQPRRNSQQWQQAAAIADVVGRKLRTGGHEIEVEALVGGLYGLSTSDMRWSLDVIDSAADLEAMRNLRLAPTLEIVPITVR
jgi:adenine-specific DNA-methyltransferase